MNSFTTTDEYVALQPTQLQPCLQKIRQTILKINPNIVEKISWNMPTFWLKKNIAHFFVYKNHIGFYPSPLAVDAFKHEFEESGYTYSKGTVRFPLDKPVPYSLIERMVIFNLNHLDKL